MTTNPIIRLTACAIAAGAIAFAAASVEAKSLKTTSPVKTKAKDKTKGFSFNTGEPLLMDATIKPKAGKTKRTKKSRRRRRAKKLKVFRMRRGTRVGLRAHASSIPTIADNQNLAGKQFGKTLTARVVDQNVRRLTPRLHRCRRWAVSARAVAIDLRVAANGVIDSVRVRNGKRLERSALSRCLKRYAKRYRFPKAAAHTPVSFQFRTR